MIIDVLRGILEFSGGVREATLQSIVCLFIINNGFIKTAEIGNESMIALNRLYDAGLVQYSDDGIFLIECMADIPESLQDSMFKEFWGQYPLEGKIGKEKCRKMMSKIKTKKKYSDLMLALKTYKEFLEKKKATFGTMPYIKHAYTFVNNYKDFLPESEINAVIDNMKSESSKKLDKLDEMWGRLGV
jgi:hypothetical protein